MTDRQARWAQLTLSIIAIVCSAYVLIALLTGCDPPRAVQVQQDIATCRGICGARPIDDFSSGENWRNLSCRCGKLDPPPSPCPDAGTKVFVPPW